MTLFNHFFCSLISFFSNNNYNKLVLAQHLDDLAESFMMSALHNGQIRTMKANYVIDAGDIRVIRPLIYVRETQTRDFSNDSKLPVINENCPACFEQPKERDRMKKLLLQEESMIPALYSNLKRGLIPLMDDRTHKLMNNINNEIELIGKETNNKYNNNNKQSSKKKHVIEDSSDMIIEDENNNRTKRLKTIIEVEK